MKTTYSIIAALGILGSVNAAVLTLSNADFQTSGNNTDPTSWTVTNTSGVYVYADGGSIPTGTNVLAYNNNAGPGTIQQSFLTSGPNGATGETFGSYTVGFDYGKRANQLNSVFTYTFSLINVTDSTVLGTTTFVLNNAAATADTYAALGTSSVTINYDNTLLANAGDTVALQIGFVSTGSQSFINTGWVDNITVNAVPEPSAALLGALGVLGLLRRRR